MASQSLGITLSAQVLRTQLASTGKAKLRLLSDSMRPVWRAGENIEVHRCEATHTLVGQCVAFERAGRVVVHRVIAQEANTLRTRGIASRAADPPVAIGDVIGVVPQSFRARVRAAAWHMAYRVRHVAPTFMG